MIKKQKTNQIKVADNVTSQLCGLKLADCVVAPPSIATPTLNRPSIPTLPALSGNKTPSIPMPSSALAPTSGSPHRPPSDPSLRLKIESLKMKQRADSFFNSLTPEQTGKVVRWIGEDNIIEAWQRVTKPVPEGLGLAVNLATIRRLRDAWRAEDLVTFSRSAMDIVIDMEQELDLSQAARLQTAMNQMLSETAFEHMRTQPASPLLKELLGNIQKLTDLELKRQKLQLEREKLLLKHSSRPSAPNTADHPSVQHHRVDLNIVPQNANPARESVVIESPSEPPLRSQPQSQQRPSKSQLNPPIL